jgi:hypothetical protein
MLTGHAAFARDTITDTLAAIVEREPDWRALPDATPTHVRRLLQRCLEKDPRRRWRDIGDAGIDLDAAHVAPTLTQDAARLGMRGRRRRLWTLAAAFGVVAITAGWFIRSVSARVLLPLSHGRYG